MYDRDSYLSRFYFFIPEINYIEKGGIHMIKQKGTGRALSMPAGLACGMITSLGTLFGGTAIIAKLIESETVSWKNAGYIILVILILSSWVGGLTSYRKIKRQKAAVCIINGLLLFLSLIIITALFFGGQYSGVGETVILLICGSALAILTETEGKRKTKRRMQLFNR